MAGSKPSRQELNRRRRRGGFIGRHSELNAFRENLGRDPAEDAFQYLFHVHGQAGVGKTTLVRQWETVARESGAVTAYLDDDVHSAIEAMEAISAQLARQQVALKRFEKLLAAYRQRRHEAETLAVSAAAPAAGTAEPGQPAPVSTSSTFIAQAGLAGLGLVPGLGAVAGAMDPQQLAQSTDRLRAALGARLRSHDDVQLVLSPVQTLTPVFLQDLAEAAERHPWVVLFFDVFERTGLVLNGWLRDVLTGEEYGELPANLVAVLSGQGQLDTHCWSDQLELVADIPLAVFTEEEARRLLLTRGVTAPDVIELVLHLTGRLPVLVDLLAQARPHSTSEIDDPTDTAVERFLKWETDSHRRAAALICALPLQLDEDLFRILAAETAAAGAGAGAGAGTAAAGTVATAATAAAGAAGADYAWLRGLPFVSGQAGRCRYHDVVRNPVLRLQRTQSPANWQRHHRLLADIHQERRQNLQSGLPAEQRWDDASWRELLLNETYHRLCADPHQALPGVLRHLLHACDKGPAVLSRWCQILTQAGTDTDADILTTWARRLAPPDRETDEPAVLVNALTQLLTAPHLGIADQALAHSILGREHRQAERHEQSLTDYTMALALDPRLERAHNGRAMTFLALGRYEEALTDLDKAVELNPDDGDNLGDRGEVLRLIGRYDDALVDFDRAIEIDPADAWALASRGQTHRALGHYDKALSDLNRAIELDESYSWALAERGEVHRLADRFDEALADFDRALELDPGYAWAIASRGQTHRAMDHIEEALADWTHAVGLLPDNAWLRTERGLTYQVMHLYDDALTDFDRAVELDVGDAWVFAQRGETYRLAGRYEEALADFGRALELDPGYAWAIASRGQTHRAMGHYDDALADFDRAGELLPDNAWVSAERGLTYQFMGLDSEALLDFDRAVELDSDYRWAIGQRGETYRLAGRYEEALADFGRALELDPGYAWAIASRGQTHHAMGHYDDALADFDRAVELDGGGAWYIVSRGKTHRAMGHYDDALADFERAVELDADDSWAHFEAAVTLRLLGRPQEDEYWRRTLAILADEISEGGRDALEARGNLFVVYCTLPDWDKASEALEAFLACPLQPADSRDVLEFLSSLQQSLPIDQALFDPLRRRLESAAGR